MWKLLIIVGGMDANLEPLIVTHHPPGGVFYSQEECGVYAGMPRMYNNSWDFVRDIELPKFNKEAQRLDYIVTLDVLCLSQHHDGYHDPTVYKRNEKLLGAIATATEEVKATQK